MIHLLRSVRALCVSQMLLVALASPIWGQFANSEVPAKLREIELTCIAETLAYFGPTNIRL